MFIKILILTLAVTALVFAGLAIRILLSRNGSFPETHISRNPEMQKRGISCARDTDTGCNPTDENIGCCSCSIREH